MASAARVTSTSKSNEKPLILFACSAIFGHAAPLCVIASDFVERGYDTTVLTASCFRPQVAKSGAKFIPFSGKADADLSKLEEQFPNVAKLPPGLERLIEEHISLFVDTIPDQFQAVQRFLEEAAAKSKQVILFRDICFLGANPIALGAPGLRPLAHIGIGVIPVTLQSIDTPIFTSALPPDSSEKGRKQNKAMAEGLKQALNPVQERYLAVLKDLHATSTPDFYTQDMVLCSDLFLQACIPEIEYPRSDLPENFRYIGKIPNVYSGDFALPPWWGEVTAHKKKVIGVTQGTLATNPQDLIIPTLEDLKDMDVLVVATIVVDDKIAGYTPPANARIAKFIPFDELLQHTDVMVSNGGYGGVQQAFAAGIPMVLAGQSEDKQATTSRAAWTGAAINLAVHRPDSGMVREAVEKVMGSDRYKTRASELKEAYARMDSLSSIAKLVDKIVAAGGLENE